MKPFYIPLFISFLGVGLFSAIRAQETPPAGLAEVETARSRSCVGILARLAELNGTLEPISRRLERLNALGRAVSLEQSEDVAPFVSEDPLEAAVAEWFASDSVLAVRYLATPDSAFLRERAAGRTAILERIRSAIQESVREGQERAREGAPVQREAQLCEGAIFVRSAVLEACATTESPICNAASADPEEQGAGRFVDSPEALWDIEQYRPWTEPAPLQPGPSGGLVGARTSAQVRRGNVTFSLTLAPLIQARSELSEEAILASQANLDSLGFVFDHPSFVLAPGFELMAQLPAPLGGETHYVLHFGDLSGDDVIWSREAGGPERVQVSFPATGSQLARLRAGEPVSLTALRVQESEAESRAEGVFSLTLLEVGQATHAGTVLEYMSTGALGRDLAALIPPESGGGGP